MFGSDFWKWATFLMHVIKILFEVFEDNGDDVKSKTHFDELRLTMKNFSNASSKTRKTNV